MLPSMFFNRGPSRFQSYLPTLEDEDNDNDFARKRKDLYELVTDPEEIEDNDLWIEGPEDEPMGKKL